MTKVYFDVRWFGDHGIGRFAREVYRRIESLSDIEGTVRPASALDPFYLSYKLARLPRGARFFSPGFSAPLSGIVPFAFTIHDLNHLDFAGSRTRLKRLYYEKILKPACHSARIIFTVSEYSRGRISEWSGVDREKIINVGNGVQDCFCATGASYYHQRPYVFCVGNRKPHKNEIRTLEAFSFLQKLVPHDILFSGRDSPELVRGVQSFGLSGRVHFIGTVSDEELASVYRGADALAFVSLYEGFGLPLIEAMACGTPVVTSNVCSLPEVAGGAALLVDPQSSADIAEALQHVLLDKHKASLLVEEGFKNAMRYSWDRTGNLVRMALEEFLI